MSEVTAHASVYRRLPVPRVAPVVTFIHAQPPDRTRFQPIRNLPSGWVKPNGGLWTSPQDSGWGWREWRRSENFGDPSAPTHVLTPAPDTGLAVIDSVCDLRAFLTAYPGPSLGSPFDVWGDEHLDFEALARDYDGLWLTERGERQTRYGRPNLNGWDCETVLFFRWVFAC